MKRKIGYLIICMVIQGFNLFAQIPGKSSEAPFKAIDNEVYYVGDTLTMGIGSNTDGSFNYIYVPANVYMGSKKITYSSAGHGLRFVLKHFSVVKNSGITYGVFTYVPEKKHDVGFMNAMVDINLALESGELVSKSSSFKNKSQRQESINKPDDKLDKLEKLKNLYDSGALTKEEYDTEKKKILDQ